MKLTKMLNKLTRVFDLVVIGDDKDELLSELVIRAVLAAFYKTAEAYPGLYEELKKIKNKDISSGLIVPTAQAVEKLLTPTSDEYFYNQFKKIINEYLDLVLPTLSNEVREKVSEIWNTSD